MIGKTISHYRIIEKLGQGGMGEVYRALDENLGRDVAIKVLHRELMHDPDHLSRFEREAKAVAKLAHPNILAIHDFGLTGGVAFAVTELLEGETLRQRLTRERLQWRKAVAIAAAIADGLAAAHAKGITHRDIKPENIFLTDDGRVKILDFGLARIGLPPVADPMAPTLTVPHLNGEAVMGTLGYMAPEQLRGETADVRSDIFALGCVIYEMLTAQRAFSRGSFALTVTAILMDPAPEVHVSGMEATLELNRIVGRCLEKNPGERFQSASDLAFALRSLLTEKHRVPAASAGIHSADSALPSVHDRSRTFEVAPGKSVKTKRFLRLILVPALLLCILAIAMGLWMATESEIALAVLPFENPVADKNSLGESLQERLNTSIRELDIIKVKPLLNRQAFDGKELDFPALATKLGVAALLKGRYRQADDNLELYIELIDGRTGNLISSDRFSEKHTRVMEDVAEIARSVVEKLRPKLGPAEIDRLDCLVFYGKGCDELDKRSRESLGTAIQFFKEALKKNPKHALAYVGLANSYNMLGIYGVDDPKTAFPLGKQAAGEALKIDNSLAEAHTSLAFAMERYELARQAAQQEYELAIKLGFSKPDSLATTYHRYGIYFLGLGRFQEAIEKIQLAKAANPFSQIMMADLAQPYLYRGDLASAIRICEQTIARFPSFAPAYRYRGLAYEQEENFTKAIADLEMAVRLSGDSPLMKGELGHVLASAGKKDRAMSILSELQEQRRTGYSSCFRIAQIYACLGDREAALKHLEQAVEEKDPFLWFLGIDPIFRKKIGDEPRFKQLKNRLARR